MVDGVNESVDDGHVWLAPLRQSMGGEGTLDSNETLSETSNLLEVVLDDMVCLSASKNYLLFSILLIYCS